MTLTELAAWIGATSGLGSLCWNMYTKVTSGPRLKVSAFADMLIVPPVERDKRFLSLTVRNIGTAPTTITTVVFRTSNARRLKKGQKQPFSAVLNHHRGPLLPYVLQVGSQWQAQMSQDSAFDDVLKSGPLYCAIYHSFSAKPVIVKISRTAT